MTENILKTVSSQDIEDQNQDIVPFETAQDAWFWFIEAQQARNDGARIVAGSGLLQRPCEPVDILKILDGLYRKRRLLRDHLLVLRHYGRRGMPPDSRRVKEARAAHIWDEALERLEPIFERKNIIRRTSWVEKHYAYALTDNKSNHTQTHIEESV